MKKVSREFKPALCLAMALTPPRMRMIWHAPSKCVCHGPTADSCVYPVLAVINHGGHGSTSAMKRVRTPTRVTSEMRVAGSAMFLPMRLRVWDLER